jgi:L-ascorbate metabolism protein UlaG (beta-lactamase superfamily)
MGKDLFRVVDQCQRDAFWWLGQHSFIVKLSGKTLLIDPFLMEMERRIVLPLFNARDAKSVRLVLCTHDHLDHLDPFAIAELSHHTEAHFIAPKAHEARMLSLGVSSKRLSLLNDKESILYEGLKITAIKAAHEFFDQTPEGYFPYLGYVIESANKAVYHAGDTVWWEGLQSQLAGWHFDVAMVPINGRDALRYKKGVIGNMTYQEAADLLGGLEVKLSVPTHYDMFDGNRENPQLFVDFMSVKYPDKQVWVGTVSKEVGF